MRIINDVRARFFKKIFLAVYVLNRYHYAIAFLKFCFFLKKGFFLWYHLKECHHGKGATDAVKRAIKKKFYRDVKSGKINIKGTK